MTPPRLQLDFRRPPATAARWAGWAMLAVAAVAAAAVGDGLADATQRHAEAQSRFDKLSQRLNAKAPRRVAVAPDPLTLASVQRANAVIDQLTVPWDELFDAVETADARGLAVLSLTPNARERSLRLAGESRSMDELLAYVGRVAAQPSLSQVHLQGYNTVQREGVPVLAFTLAARWVQQP